MIRFSLNVQVFSRRHLALRFRANEPLLRLLAVTDRIPFDSGQHHSFEAGCFVSDLGSGSLHGLPLDLLCVLKEILRQLPRMLWTKRHESYGAIEFYRDCALTGIISDIHPLPRVFGF